MNRSWLVIPTLIAASGLARGADQALLPPPPLSPTLVRLTPVADGLSGSIDGVTQYFATDLAPIPDGSGRLLLMTLGGVVRLIDPDDGLSPAPYLVTANPDTLIVPANFGMVSIAPHPDFATPGAPGFARFYTIETEPVTAGVPDFDDSLQQNAFGGQHHDVVYEYTASDPDADVFAGERREILRVEQPGFDHNITDLAFGIGDDRGLLYITSGDGANAGEGIAPIRNNARSLGTVHGKVLRIDPLGSDSANGRYGVPPDNPFVGTPNARAEIFTLGHRSPYRLTVDRLTGELWLGEVGQIQVEEVNRLEPGHDYGWSLKEGSFLFDQTDHDNDQPDPDLDSNGTGDFADANALTDPVFELDHRTSRSLTGGFVYRGTRVPALAGMYVFADAFSPGIYAGDPSVGPVSAQTGPVERLAVSPDGVAQPLGVISIGEDDAGELYLLTIDGRVLRIDPAPCSAFDLALPLGVLNFFDIAAYIASYAAGDTSADLAAPFGTLNFFDITAYVAGYSQGCP